MSFFGNKRKDFSIQPPTQQVNSTPFFVTDSANIDFTLNNLNLSANLTLTGVISGTYGSSTQVPVLQIDQWGRITGVTLQTISTSGLALETNGTPNGDQTLLNLVAGTNMTITDDGLGNITFDATGGGTYTVDNGLTENPVGNFQLGSTISGGAPLLHDTYIDTLVNHTLYLEGSKTNSNDFILDVNNLTANGSAIKASTIGSGNAIRATSVNASAISSVSTTAPGITVTGTSADGAGYFRYNSTGNTVVPGIKLWHSTSATPAAGLGISLLFSAETTLNSGLNLGKIYYEWLNAVTSTRASKFSITTVGGSPVVESVKLSIDDLGQLSLPEYSTNAFPGTPAYALGVDTSGDVIQFTPSTGGGGIKSGNATQVSPGVYTTTISGVTSYTAGDTYIIKFDSVNDGDSTLNISGVGAIPMRRNTDVKLNTGAIKANQEITVVYDGTNFQLIGLINDQILAYVHNAEGAIISKGQAVYAYQATGGKMSVKLARADSDATSAKTIGLVYDASIGIGGEGYIITQGVLEGVNTSMFSAGDTLYLSGVTFGAYVNTPVYAPTHFVYVGIVERANANGQIYVRCQNGYELDELHNVQAQSPTINDVLYYFGGSPGQWKTAQASTLLPTSYSVGSFGVTVDGVTAVIQVGTVGYVVMPYAGTITGWSITANVSGNIQFDVWRASGAIPTVANTIISNAAFKPKLTSSNFATSTTLTSWTTGFLAGDVFGFYVDSASTIKNATLTIRTTKT